MFYLFVCCLCVFVCLLLFLWFFTSSAPAVPVDELALLVLQWKSQETMVLKPETWNGIFILPFTLCQVSLAHLSLLSSVSSQRSSTLEMPFSMLGLINPTSNFNIFLPSTSQAYSSSFF